MTCETLDAIPVVSGSITTWACTYTEDDGITPVNLTGYTIAAYIRTQDGELVAQLTGSITDASAGEFDLPVDADGWPAGTHRMDIRYTSGSTVVFSQMARVDCTRPETETRAGD